MGYVLYSICFSSILFVTAVAVTRSYWLPLLEDVHVPGANYLYSRLPTSFADDIEAGLSSSNFDLNANVEAGDSRQGLDTTAKAEITKIMKKRRMTFDQARKVYMENRFKANGIGPDGLPRDPKFVSFS